MALIDAVKQACARLAPQGWDKLLKKHGLDITKPNLETELDRQLPIDRDVPGFEDFAFEGRCGVQPGSPARSLLFHAFASPNVVAVDGAALDAFPTLAEIDAIENYVFGVHPPSLAELSALAAGDLLAVAVFAVEYRVAVETVHRRHADLCYSRTGVARVGTNPPLYDGRARGFVPFVAGSANALRVLPARYAAYIAVQRTGDEASFGPMRFDFRRKHPDLFGAAASDSNRKFWVPLHKVFPGDECLRDHQNLRVELIAHHVNEKIRRIHLELTARGHLTGSTQPEIDRPPFRFTEGIAGFSTGEADFGAGVLVPVPHAPLVELAEVDGVPLTFIVPPQANDFSPSLTISSNGRARPAPEYVHVRTAPNEAAPNLNDLPDVVDVVNTGGYRAQHYIDFTGDGWVEAACPDLAVELPRNVPAYSVVTAPDFYFSVDQRELLDWWLERAPSALREFLWETPPLSLADERVAPNLQLNSPVTGTGTEVAPNANFRPEDDTVTAIVSMPLRDQRQERPLRLALDNRHSSLPDAAAGVFAPGWDTSIDRTAGVTHLAAYGLGSPFPEDSKLCAALSTFWPSVAPDAGRSFSDSFPTISPMTDQELGANGTGGASWDGVPGPRVVQVGAQRVVEYAAFSHVDYVLNAVDGLFSLARTGLVNTREYTARVLAMARTYLAAGVPQAEPGRKRQWNVLSFQAVLTNDAALTAALDQAGTSVAMLGSGVFRVVLFKPAAAVTQPADHRKVHVAITAETTVYVGGTTTLLVKVGAGPFTRRVVNA